MPSITHITSLEQSLLISQEGVIMTTRIEQRDRNLHKRLERKLIKQAKLNKQQNKVDLQIQSITKKMTRIKVNDLSGL